MLTSMNALAKADDGIDQPATHNVSTWSSLSSSEADTIPSRALEYRQFMTDKCQFLIAYDLSSPDLGDLAIAMRSNSHLVPSSPWPSPDSHLGDTKPNTCIYILHLFPSVPSWAV